MTACSVGISKPSVPLRKRTIRRAQARAIALLTSNRNRLSVVLLTVVDDRLLERLPPSPGRDRSRELPVSP